MSSHPIQVLRPSSLYIIFVSPGPHTRARALCGFSRSSSSSCSSLSFPSFYLPLFLSGRRHAPLIGLSKKMWKTTTFPSSLACPASPRNPRTIIRLCPTYPLLFCRVCHHCLQWSHLPFSFQFISCKFLSVAFAPLFCPSTSRLISILNTKKKKKPPRRFRFVSFCPRLSRSVFVWTTNQKEREFVFIYDTHNTLNFFFFFGLVFKRISSGNPAG